jgi:hypothetical protein
MQVLADGPDRDIDNRRVEQGWDEPDQKDDDEPDYRRVELVLWVAAGPRGCGVLLMKSKAGMPATELDGCYPQNSSKA